MIVQRAARRMLARRTLRKRQQEAEARGAPLARSTTAAGTSYKDMVYAFSELAKEYTALLEGVVDESEPHPDDVFDDEPDPDNPYVYSLPHVPHVHVPERVSLPRWGL